MSSDPNSNGFAYKYFVMIKIWFNSLITQTNYMKPTNRAQNCYANHKQIHFQSKWLKPTFTFENIKCNYFCWAKYMLLIRYRCHAFVIQMLWLYDKIVGNTMIKCHESEIWKYASWTEFWWNENSTLLLMQIKWTSSTKMNYFFEILFVVHFIWNN